MKTIAILIIALGAHEAFGAFEVTHRGSRSAAMGNSVVGLANNEWAGLMNPAGLSSSGGSTVSLFYVPQSFELKELSRSAVNITTPTSWGTFAISATRFGFDMYREVGVAVSYAHDIVESIRGGITINYYSLSIQNYGAAASFGVDIGVLVGISENVNWGATVSNINAPTIGVSREKLPQLFSTGITFQPMNAAVLAASIVKDIRFAAELHFGVEYSFLETVAVRVGTTSDPNTLNAGLGVSYLFAKLDYAFSSHNELGITHQFSVSLNLSAL